MVVPLLIISGPVGVGKTTVGEEVNTLLEQQCVAHSFIDLDALACTYPRPPSDRFGRGIALQNLRCVWANCARAGSRNLVIARVIETESDLHDIAASIPDSVPHVCQLSAGDETLRARVGNREIGSGRVWHQRRAVELSKILAGPVPADFRIETDHRSIPKIAAEIVERVPWVWPDATNSDRGSF
jgi:hypothetical protein